VREREREREGVKKGREEKRKRVSDSREMRTRDRQIDLVARPLDKRESAQNKEPSDKA